MTIYSIVQRAYYLTVSNPALWIAGIFLSSGFNLHLWYVWNWLEHSPVASQIKLEMYSYPPAYIAIASAVVFLVGLVVANFVKLLFLFLLHGSMHDSKLLMCWLCKQIEEERNFWQIIKDKIFSRVLAVSLFTIGVSLLCVSLFNWYFIQFNAQVGSFMLVFACLLVALIGISLWNLFSVISIFWYGMNFNQASKVSCDLLFLKFKNVFALTTVVTIIFLSSVSFGGMVIWQIPKFLSSNSFLFFGDTVTLGVRMTASLFAVVIFFAWLTINNVWFNIAMILFYTDVITAQKSGLKIEKPIVNPKPTVA